MSKGKNSTRRGERALAFQILYGLSFTPAQDEDALRHAYWQSPDNADRDPSMDDATPPEGFAWELILGVWQQETALDAVVARFSRNWRVDRIGRIELTLLRLGLYEMLFRQDVPTKVAINEALELAKQFGEQSARPFVNGILDSVARAMDSGENVLSSENAE